MPERWPGAQVVVALLQPARGEEMQWQRGREELRNPAGAVDLVPLARVTQLLRGRALREALVGARDADELYRLLVAADRPSR
jgi:hypothetical protein